MSISLSSDLASVANQLSTQNTSAAKSAALQSKLNNLDGATDAELMEACKSFEAYLVEQVMTKVKDAIVPEKEDEDNDYVKMFGDRLYKEYAQTMTDSGQLGLAQKLYEAMKRNNGVQN